MNLFNQFNCRIVEEDKFNIFSGLLTNYFFVMVIAFEFFLTWLMVEIGATTIGSSLIGTAKLTTVEHIVCWCVGASTLIWGAILKKIPLDHFKKVADHIDLENEEDGKLNMAFNHANDMHAKARRSIGIAAEDDQGRGSVSTKTRDFDDDDEATGEEHE